MNNNKEKKVFAAASFGGHWMQLLRITLPLEDKYEVVYASTHPKCSKMIGTGHFHLIKDFSRQDAWHLLPAFFQDLSILRKEHPDVVMTTGAAPGLIVLFAAWLLRYKTVWIDSIANADHLSFSGRIAKHFASRVYTQWPDLADKGIIYYGTVYGEIRKTNNNQHDE